MGELHPEDVKLLHALKFRSDQKRLGYTNKQMGDAIGYCQSQIGHMRSGRRPVTLVAQKLMDALIKREELDSYDLEKYSRTGKSD